MTPEQVASQLIQLSYPPNKVTIPADLQPHLSEAVIRALANQARPEELSKAETAVKIADIITAVAQTLETAQAEALGLWMRGYVLFGLNRYQEVLEFFQRAEPYYRAQEEYLIVAGLKINQMAVLQELGRYAEALQHEAGARTMCEAAGEDGEPYLANLEMNAGWCWQQTGAWKAAEEAYARAYELYVKHNNQVQAARAEVNQALLLQEQDQFTDATTLLQTGRTTLAEAQCDQEVTRVDLNLGLLAFKRARYQEALAHLEAAHTGFAAIPNPVEVAVVDLYRSFVYRELNLLQETVQIAGEAAATFSRQRMSAERALALINQGVGYQRLELYAEAERAFTQARRLLQRQRAIARLQALDVDRAHLAWLQGRHKSAQRIAKRLLRQIPAERPGLLARSHLILARCFLAQKLPDDQRARSHIEQALTLAQAFDLTAVLINAYSLMATLLERTGKLEQAWQMTVTALHRVEQLRALFNLDEFLLAFMIDKLPIYDSFVRLTQKIKTPAVLLQALNLAYTAPLQSAAGDSAEKDNAWQAQLQGLREQWHWVQNKLEPTGFPSDENTDSSEPSLAEVTEWRAQRANLEAQMAELMRRQQVRRHVTQSDDNVQRLGVDEETAVSFLNAIQAKLDSHELLLQYYFAEGQLHALLVTADDIVSITNLVPLATLRNLLRTWEMHLEQREILAPVLATQLAQAALKRLHQMLRQPLTDLLEGYSQVYLVVPPGLHNIPFAALFDGRHYWAEQTCLTYLSAPAALLADTRSFVWEQTARPQALVMGYSDNGRFPQAPQEAQQIAEALPDHWQVTGLLEQDARLDQLRQASQTCHLLHIASHAVFRPDNPRFSWVRLAGERMTVADLATIRLPQRPLVVLSACETGRGQARGGGLVGMSRGFQAAGAGGLVVSRWPADDVATAQLMTAFYNNLIAARQSVAFALHEAQQRQIAAGKHPFYWAGFIYIQEY